jgi:hypothetical protein
MRAAEIALARAIAGRMTVRAALMGQDLGGFVKQRDRSLSGIADRSKATDIGKALRR